MSIKTGKELADACEELALNYKTLYVMGCFGAPLTSSAKDRYIRAQNYNQKPTRTEKIKAASANTYGFDCVGMIKALLWGWNGDAHAVYGGAAYAANGVPDIDANAMLRKCAGISRDFRNIPIGAALGMKNHIGIYIGDGLAVECTPAWKDGCQITAVGNMGKKAGYYTRSWERWGMLPYVDYEQLTPAPKPAPETAPKTEDDEMYNRELFVRDIQNVTGCEIDGNAGPETLAALPTISKTRNETSKVVLPVQKRLAALGYYKGTLDGEAGDRFDEAVKAFQKSIENPNIDGELTSGQRTWRYLLGKE